MKNLHWVQEKLNKAAAHYSGSFCASWVNPAAKADGRGAADQKLIGFLFAVPFISLLNAATTPSVFLNPMPVMALLALSFAVPMMLAAWISASKTATACKVVTVSLAPMALGLISQMHINSVAISCLLLGVLIAESFKRTFDRAFIAYASIATVIAASVLIARDAHAGDAASALIGLVPCMLGALAYSQLGPKTEERKEDVSSRFDFEMASLFAQSGGQALVEVSRTAQVLRLSPNCHDVLGLDRDQMLASAFIERVHIGDRVALLTLLDQVDSGGARASCAFRLQAGPRAGNGANAWVDVQGEIFGTGAALMIMISKPMGVSEAPNAQFDTNALAMVSHELRTPLNAIIGFSDLIGKGLAGPIANERQSEYIDLIHQSGQHLLELVNSILDLSKLENGTYELAAEQFVPEEATLFAISMLSVQAREKQLGLNYLPLAGLADFHGDKRIYQQILINLLSNAVKFTPAHGTITLSVEQEGKRLLICVEDNGVGMSREQLAKAGTPFYQASGTLARQHEGAGLGLSLVRKMAKLHGGALEITSDLGKGTTVRVALAAQVSANQIAFLHASKADESTRIISINEEREHGPYAKTA